MNLAEGTITEAVGADKPQAMRPCGLLRGVGERVGTVTQPRGDNDRRRGTLRTRRRDDLGYRRRRQAVDAFVIWIDDMKRTTEAAGAQIAGYRAAQ